MKNAFYRKKKSYLYKLYIVLAVLAWLPLSLCAIDTSSLSFRSITISDGLSNNIINTIYKDKRGFVWLGTQTGLDRFDGIDVISFPQFSARTIYAIAETDSVYLWVGTDKGLLKFDRKTEQVEAITLDDKSLEARTLYVDKEGRLLVGTSRGLFVYRNNAFHRVLFDSNALSSTNFLTGIIEGQEDTFWMTSQNGLIEYNKVSGKSEVYKYVADQGGTNTLSCLALIGDRLFLGTSGKGLLGFDIKKKTFSACPDIGNRYIKSVVADGKDTVYVGTNGSGVKLIEASTGREISSIEHAADSKGICSNAVYSLLKDGDMLFVGTYMGGLSYTPAHGNVFSVYSCPGLLDTYNLNVRAFWIDTDGRKIIGTRDGLYYLSPSANLLKHYTHKNSLLRSDIILSVKPVREGYLIGTYGGGLYLLHADSGELTFFKSDSCFMQGSFNGYAKDKDDNLWIGSSGGVYVYTPSTGEYKVYNSRNSSLSVNSIFSLRADSKNRIWLGTGEAVFMYDVSTGTFKSDVFPENIRPYTKSVRYIYEDRNKNLWFCDDKEGVVKVDEHFTKFEHFTTDDFLPNNSVMSIIESPEEEGLWFATQRGLVYVKEEGGETHKIFSLYDGIPGYIFNYPVQITGDTIWWGNERGLVYYKATNTKRKASEKACLPPAITSLSVAGRPLRAGEAMMPFSATFLQEISLPAGENNVAFTFSALNYAVENTDLYEYCLEGYDKEWRTLQKGNQVAYNELPVGNYLFKVRAASNPAAVKSVRVEVARGGAFIWWMVLLCVSVCAVILYFYSGLLSRYRRIKERMNEKTEPVKEVPKEKYQKAKMEEGAAGTVSKKLGEVMRQDKLYLNPDLKLQDVAGAVGCSAVELSQVLNVFMNTNFTDFINQYRVDEFIKKIQDKSASKYTLASLSEQCGFSSRTSFFRSFKKLKGMSPAEYIKEHGICIE